MLLILAEFPDISTQHEGMAQRVMAIDRLCASEQRVYLVVSHRRFWKIEEVRLGEKAVQYRCNTLKHAIFIRGVLKRADTCYFHSVMNVLTLLPFFPFIPRHTRVILDVHGVVPEERRFTGHRWKAQLYEIAERSVFRRVDKVIAVSDAMTRHFREKYPKWGGPAATYPILPAHIGNEIDVGAVNAAEHDVVNVIYSGNLQSWQNIDLMLSIIKKHLTGQIKFWILTGQRQEMEQRMGAANLPFDPCISVLTVAPHELHRYYRIAHYGFILRDDVIVNRVACPTKLVEYLHAGIVPIVLSPTIGDFAEMDYEYLLYTDFSANLPMRKSMKNKRLMENYISEIRTVDFARLIGSES